MTLLTRLPHRDADPVVSNGVISLNKGELMALLGELSGQLARFANERVALLLDNDIPWLVLDLAFASMGTVSIPVPVFFTEQQTEHMLKASGATLLVSDRPCGLGESETLEVAGQSLHLYRLTPALSVMPFPGTQKITYTSGSTGMPKGVCLSLENQLSVAQALADKIAIKQPLHLCLLPLAVLLENVAGIYTPLLSGGCVVVKPLAQLGFNGTRLSEPERLIATLDAVQPNSLILVPELLALLLAFAEKGWQPPTSLQFIAVGGGVVNSQQIERARALGLPVYQGYGLSEAGSVVSLNTPNDDDVTTAGRVLDGIETRIADGELQVRNRLFLGYLGGEAFPEGQWYGTGDLVECTDGRLSIVGRRKNLLISSFGRNISPEWPESLLLGEPGILQAVVVGDGRPHLAALIFAAPELSDAQLEQAIERVNAALPEYAQVKAYHRLARPLDAESGLLTGNNRPKRDRINEHFSEQIQCIYKGAEMSSFYQVLQNATRLDREYLLASPIIQRAFSGDIGLNDYVAFLGQAFHHVKHTVPLLMSVGARLDDSKEWLREAVAEYIEEEIGHQEWILNDIEACGFDKESARASAPSFATEMMVAYAYDSIARKSPLCFFGMVQVLEGTSIAIADMAADSIQTRLGLPKKAFSYLKSHGALDQEHIKFFENLMNRITDEEEQKLIIHSAKRFYRLYAEIFRSLDGKHGFTPLSAEELSA